MTDPTPAPTPDAVALAVPPTEIEVADALYAVRSLTTPKVVEIVRRLAYQRNMLLAQLAAARGALLKIATWENDWKEEGCGAVQRIADEALAGKDVT